MELQKYNMSINMIKTALTILNFEIIDTWYTTADKAIPKYTLT